MRSYGPLLYLTHTYLQECLFEYAWTGGRGYALADHCGYSVLHDEMIRNRIIVGIRNTHLSEKLQLDSELTLEKAVTQVRQSEVIKQQQSLLEAQSKTHLWVQFKSKESMDVPEFHTLERSGTSEFVTH